jgi:hypothetical protein
MSEKFFLTKQKKEVVITSFIEFSFLLADLLVTHVYTPSIWKKKRI